MVGTEAAATKGGDSRSEQFETDGLFDEASEQYAQQAGHQRRRSLPRSEGAGNITALRSQSQVARPRRFACRKGPPLAVRDAKQ